MVNGAPADGYGGLLIFYGGTRAALATIFNNAPAGGAAGGETDFLNDSSADASTIMVAQGAAVRFEDRSTAGTATLVANGGTIQFEFDASGGTCRLELDGGAILNMAHHSGGVAIGSLEGDSGTVQLGSHPLSIGGNRVSTTYSGLITQGGQIIKVGRETLTLAAPNTYTGGTSIEGGMLLADNTEGSATGSGPVQVDAGTFGGRSNIAGPVTVGSGAAKAAHLSPGIGGAGKLTIKNALTFQGHGAYDCDLNLEKAKADEVVCRSAAISRGAQFILVPAGNQVLPAGTVFTVIDNAGTKPIRGTFANLPDGGTLTAGSNTLQASYEGGDGNDLTLTVQ